MSDITSLVAALAQSRKHSVHAAMKNRFEVVEVPTTQAHFLKETTEIHFRLLETQRVLDSLKSLTLSNSLFNN